MASAIAIKFKVIEKVKLVFLVVIIRLDSANKWGSSFNQCDIRSIHGDIDDRAALQQIVPGFFFCIR